MSIKPIFAWYDLWIGVYWDAGKRRLYILPIPCLGVVIQFGPGIDAEWKQLARYGLLIEAIKAHRRARGSTLKDAAGAVYAHAKVSRALANGGKHSER